MSLASGAVVVDNVCVRAGDGDLPGRGGGEDEVIFSEGEENEEVW